MLLTIIESPAHPDFAGLYRELKLEQVQVNSMRKAIAVLKRQQPDFVVAEFFYGYGNNYAGANISNLDVFLHSLEKYAPDTRVIVLVTRKEQQYADRLAEMFPLHAILLQPVREGAMREVLGQAVD